MLITQLRNATVLLEFQHAGRPVGLLVDPMLAPRGSLPALRYLGTRRQRNPLVDLPAEADTALQRVTHALITHCQRGHFDHLDRAGKQFLRERQIPVLCMPHDAAYLAQRGLQVLPLAGEGRRPFALGGQVTPVACTHGRGWVARFMEHGHGYLLELPGEPSVYLAGDTVLTPPVRDCLQRLHPGVAVLPAGGARFDLGADILMDAAEVAQAAALTTGAVVVNHLEALDHCPTTRAQVHALAQRGGWAHRLWVPEDGECREYPGPTVESNAMNLVATTA